MYKIVDNQSKITQKTTICRDREKSLCISWGFRRGKEKRVKFLCQEKEGFSFRTLPAYDANILMFINFYEENSYFSNSKMSKTKKPYLSKIDIGLAQGEC